MDSELGRNLILWTVRASVLLYVVALWRYLFPPRTQPTADHVFVMAWGGSWLLCLIHVACAFHFQHHWSQQAALQHTAELTERVVGIHWGGGLYVNYLFLTWWSIDVLRQVSQPGRSSSTMMHAAAAFMMFNATVVFGPTWWWLPLGLLVIALLWKYRTRRA